MKNKSEKKVFSILLSVTGLLIALAFGTISYTMSNVSEPVKTISLWDINYSEPTVKGEDNNYKVIVNNDRIDFNVTLKKPGDKVSFITSINNDGSYNAFLSSLETSKMNKSKIGTSEKTGKTYYLSDYVSYTVKYLDNNSTNKVRVDKDVKVGDLLKKGTSNNIIVTVKYIEENRLTEDELEVLHKNIGEEPVLDLALYLSTVYQQSN